MDTRIGRDISKFGNNPVDLHQPKPLSRCQNRLDRNQTSPIANAKSPAPKHDFKLEILYFIAAIFAVVLIRDFFTDDAHLKTIPYSEFRQLLDKSELKDLVVGPTRITGACLSPTEKGTVQHFSTVRVDSQIADDLTRRGIKFSGQPEPGSFQNLMSWLLPTAGFILMWMFLLKPMTSGHSGLMSIGRSTAQKYTPSKASRLRLLTWPVSMRLNRN